MIRVKEILEAAEKDSVEMSIPLFIRMLEWAREEAKDDIEIHEVAERAIEFKGTCLDTADYGKLIK